MKFFNALFVISILSGCGAADWNAAESTAVEACVSKFGELFPDVGAEEFSNERVVMGDLDQARLDTKSAGEFEFRYPNVAKMKNSDTAYICRGNLKSRFITSIESNGQLLAPEASQNWSY